MLGWLLAALAAGGTIAAQDFSCWKKCNSRSFHCLWSPLGPVGNTTYILHLCFEKHGCKKFKVGMMTNYSLSHFEVYVLEKTVAWVEARWGDHVLKTPNITLVFSKALINPYPPPTGMTFSKSGGQLRLQGPQPRCQDMDGTLQQEARFWRAGGSSWTQVTCETVTVTRTNYSVTCALGVNGTFVVQLRQKTKSSYWSNWSTNISVPEEILESPVLSHQLGKLGRDGQRVLRLSWQPVLKGQRDVNYMLHSRMPACGCTGQEEEDDEEDDEEDTVNKEDTVVLGWDVTEHNLTLSGAEYEILLNATNAAGPGPARQLRVPAEHHPDLSFKNISVAGGRVTAQWEAPIPGDAYCFEQQILTEAPKQGVCISEKFPAKSTHVEGGALEAPGCHRLAVHGWDQDLGWSTFALWHHYTSDAPPHADRLVVPINVSTGDVTVLLQWKPSPRAACPGALANYLICHTAEGGNMTYSKADATASNYTLQNLQPGTAYRVGVWEVTEDSEGTCNAWRHFQTEALGPQGAAWRANLKYLGISLGIPVVAAIYHLTKKRARRVFFPPLPKPVGTKAIQFLDSEMSQGQPKIGLLEPSERFNPAKLLLLEPNPRKEMTDTSTQTDVPHPDVPHPDVTHPDVSQPSPVAEKPPVVVMCPPSCGEEMSFAYRRQEMLSPVGCPSPGSTSGTGHPPSEEEEEDKEDKEEEEEEEGRQGLRQPLIPIALLISDKPIIIRDEEGWDPTPEKSVQ